MVQLIISKCVCVDSLILANKPPHERMLKDFSRIVNQIGKCMNDTCCVAKFSMYDKNPTRHKILNILPSYCIVDNYMTIRVGKCGLVHATKSNTRMHQEGKTSKWRYLPRILCLSSMYALF